MVYLHELPEDVFEEIVADTPDGLVHGIRPNVPFPAISGVFRKKYVCACGRTFKTYMDYKAHYVYHAVWENESGYLPEEIAKAVNKSRGEK